MPGAPFHSFFWDGTGGQTPIGTSAAGGYVPWQVTIIRISGLVGGLAAAVRWAPSR